MSGLVVGLDGFVSSSVMGNKVNSNPFMQRAAWAFLLAALLSGCATPPAKDFKGHWQPANRFQAQPVKIPLQPTYVYYAAPIDGTLKTMLTRWASDSGRAIEYGLDYDITLYQPVATIRTTDVQVAVSRLNDIYSAQAVRVVANAQKISVRSASDSIQTASPLALSASSLGGIRFSGTQGLKP